MTSLGSDASNQEKNLIYACEKKFRYRKYEFKKNCSQRPTRENDQLQYMLRIKDSKTGHQKEQTSDDVLVIAS
jgi:hypothetical protein